MRVFINAYENTYGGLHGIEDFGVFEVDSLDEADLTGEEMSRGVIDSYGLDDERDEDDEYDIDEDLCWEVYKIKDDREETIKELNTLANRLGSHLFIKGYCEVI